MSIAIKRNFTIPSTSAIGATELFLTSSVASTSIITGALQIVGGAGISGAISLGGPIKLFNGNFYTAFDSAATANTTYIWPATAPSTGSSVLSSDSAGNLSWILMSASSSGLTLNGLTDSTQYFSTSISGSGFTIGSTGSTHTYYIALAGNGTTGLISSTSQTIFGAKTFASGVAITSGLASTNTTTGSLTVIGGVGVGGTLNTQTLVIGSGVTGLLIQKMVGGNYAAMYSTGVTPSGTNYTFITDGQSPNFNGTNGVYFNVNNSNKVQITNTNINITPSTSSGSTSTGALTISGGVGIGGSLWTSTINYSSISGVGFLSNTIVSGIWAGTAISATNGGTGLTSYTTGDIIYASSSSSLGRISAGIAGSVLTSSGTGSTPYWTLAASTGVTTINSITTSSQFFATSIAGSGFTIGSTGSTHTYYIGLAGNASTGLISSSAQTIFGSKTFASGVAITSGIASTNTATGDLTIVGGLGVGSTVNIGGSLNVSGNLSIVQSIEQFQNYTTNIGSGSTVNLSVNSNGGIIYVNTGTVSGNWTLNVTGLALTNSYATSITTIVGQGSTAYIPSTLRISGNTQTINWQGGSAPSGNANKKDVIIFSILSTGTGTTDYLVLGQLVSFG